MKILYCTDFSDASAYSLEKFLDFLKPESNADIISVLETGFLTTIGSGSTTYSEHFEKYIKTKIDNLEKTKNFIKSKGISVEEVLYPTGDPAEEILKQVKHKNYDVVITGSRSKLFFEKWIGSTSRKVVEKSCVPVFMAKKINKPEIKGNRKNVLFAVDETESSYKAVKKAAKTLNLDNSEIEILHIKEGKESLPPEIIADKGWLDKILQKQEELANEVLEKTSSILKEEQIKADLKTVLNGSAAEEVIKYTEKNRKDLIIMGSHGREGMASLLLGSVSRGILDNTTCPILIIPTKRHETQ